MPLKLTRRSGSPFWWLAGTVAGQRIRESTGTDQRGLAEEIRATREAAIVRRAILGAAPRVTFAQAAASYLEHAGPHSPGTLARLHRILLQLGPKLACDEVDQARLDEACSALLRKGAAPATRLREVITPVRAVLGHAARRGWCQPRAFDTGRASPARTEWLTPAEADRLIGAAATHLRPLLTFLAATGARVGEALALDWQDVDLAHARAVLRDTKNGRDRAVDLCPRALGALAALAHRDGAVFRTNRGRPYAVKETGGGQIKTGWARALRAAKIGKPVSPHALRHTWASWHYALHRDLLLLKRDGDWSGVALCERYAHLVPAKMDAAIRAWRAAFAPAAAPRRRRHAGTPLTQPLPRV